MFRRAANTIIVMALVGISFVALTQWASGTGTFNPTLASSLSDNRPVQFPDRTDTLSIGPGNTATCNPGPGCGGDYNFSLVTTFTPRAFCVASNNATGVDGLHDCGATIVDPTFHTQKPNGLAVPLGAETGTLSSTTYLALTAGESINTSCNQKFVVAFTFFVASSQSPGPILHTMADGLGHHGAVDLNGDNAITAADTTVSGGTVAQGSVSGRKLKNGLFDVNGIYTQGGSGGGDGVVDANDNGVVEYKKRVIAGQLDANGDGVINSLDDGLTIDSGIVSGDPIAAPADPLVIQWQDPDGNGLYNGIDHYPNYLVTALEPPPGGVPANAIQPRLRTWGVTSVALTTVSLQFLIFDPGALQALNGPPYSSSPGMPSNFGYPSEAFLQDPDPFAAGNSQISDFCSPLSSTTTTFGTTLPGVGGALGGSRMQGNPVAGPAGFGNLDGTNASTGSGADGNTGTHFERQILESLRDADSDGIENQLDTCPQGPPNGPANSMNLDGDPRTNNGNDNDGLDSACDPDPSAGTGHNIDQDGDGFFNRLDNCPLVKNGGPGFNATAGDMTPPQQDTDKPISFKPADGGPPADGIGDVCDNNPTTPDGSVKQSIIKEGVCVGDDGSSGPNQDADLNDAAHPAPDGWCKAREAFLGTSLTDNCGTIGSPEPNTWPPDFSGDGRAEALDRSRMAREVFGGYIPVQTLVADNGGTIDVSGAGTALTNIQNGDTIQLDPGTASNEHMLVVSGGGVAGPSTLTVTRGVDGTTQVAHLAGVKIFRYNRRFDLNADNSINALDRSEEITALASGNNGQGTTDPNGVSCSP